MDPVSQFKTLLEQATVALSPEYFQLLVAGSDLPVYRERLYCYELYHQLRSLWPEGFPWSLGGEIDKSGHPIFRGSRLDHLKPDFLVHRPGNMDSNLIVIEVKPIVARVPDVIEALGSLNAFRDVAGYSLPILLVFGGDLPDLIALKDRTMAALHDKPEVEPGRIELWWHAHPAEPASRIPW